MTLNILVACEESQTESNILRQMGHNAFSCDIIKPKRGANLAIQIQDDVTSYLNGRTTFQTLDGTFHQVPRWDMIIAHPPCTYLCRLSIVQLKRNGVFNTERYKKLLQAREFFLKCLNAQAPFVVVENPVPLKIAQLPRPTTYVEPFWYGSPYSKKTCYWLKNLPPPMPLYDNQPTKQFIKCTRGKYRSRTSPQMAEAVLKQWIQFIETHYIPP